MKIRWKVIMLSISIVIIVIVFIMFFLNFYIPKNFDIALRMHGPPHMSEPGPFRRTFLTNLKNSLIYGGFFSLIIAIILSIFFSRILEKPIVDLKNATKKIEIGDFNFSIKKESNDEIGDLVDDFNTMIKKLNNLENIRKDLLSKISHDLSTPLTGIFGYIEAIEDRLIPEEKLPETLKTIKDEIERLKNLINDLREYSFIESTKFKLDLEELNLSSEIEHSLNIIKNKYLNKKINIFFNSKDLIISGDKKRIGEIFNNLFDNAFKFSYENGNIYIDLKKEDDKVKITIKDEGVGIDKEDIPFIFDKFYKGKNLENVDSKGFGLGLSIVKELVEAHKGKILVISEKGKGTEFILTFPIIKK
ncbi:MAG: HAMP domain-containing sensor histidine kinase [Caldisericia bacterium]